MDVTARAVLILSLFLTACSVPKSADTVFATEKDECQDLAVRNQFIVRWTDGRISVEKGRDKETFKKEFVEKNLEQIDLVEFDHRVRVQQNSPSGYPPTFGFDNWGISSAHIPAVWQAGVRGAGVVVAVLDNGVQTDHPDLQNRIFYNTGESGSDSQGRDKRMNGIDDDGNGYIDDFRGYDFALDSGNVTGTLEESHGTHVSGIIAAYHQDNSLNTSHMQGVAPEAKILPIDFMSGEGGVLSDAIRGIDYAIQRGADIINASWGGSGCSVALGQKIMALQDHNILFVAAAGNDHQDIDVFHTYPAAYGSPGMITVGSINTNLTMSSFSNWGRQHVQLFAPGFEIKSTYPTNNYRAESGTSMAAPFVSGAAALLWSYRPQASLTEIRAAILNSVVKNNQYFNSTQGRLDMTNALQALDQALH